MRDARQCTEERIIVDTAGLTMGETPLRICDLETPKERLLLLTHDVRVTSRGYIEWWESSNVQNLSMKVTVHDNKGEKWEISKAHGRMETKSAAGLLEDFCRLAEASDKQVLEFAERWGVLAFQDKRFPSHF